ncbi:MAG TPA: GNAT family N-acetyltransferase [Azospirillaceae bacterium]|nr:GNAT family N-acetyltransferase [Azospirillaceae bacterium]
MTASIVDARSGAVQAALAAHPLGSLFTAPPWLDALAETYGFAIAASVPGQGSNRQGAVLFSRISDLRGERIVCLPFSDYCDPLVEDAETWETLAAPLMEMGLPITLRCLRHGHAVADPRFAATGQALWHGVDLTRSEEDLWAGLSGSARQNVRKAQRGGVTVREASGLDDVRAFHRMHCHLRKTKFRLLAQPRAFFDALHAAFAPEGRLTVLFAEVEGAPVAGILFLEWENRLYYKFNASLDPTLCPNDLLAWEGIRMGRRRGLELLDFGISETRHPGLIRYKRKYATEERTISLLRWQPPGHADARAAEIGRAFGRITELLTDPTVPDAVTEAAGDDLYRYFC